MKYRIKSLMPLLLSLFTLLSCQAKSIPSQAITQTSDQKLTAFLNQTLQKHQLVGIIAAASNANELTRLASAGSRKFKTPVAIKPDDTVHLGSCTKAMTCAMLATLIEQGKLSWQTKMVDILKEFKGIQNERYDQVTLWDLVTHRSGMPANAKNWWAHRDLPLERTRLKILKDNLKLKNAGTQQGTYKYSNLSYMAAGCIASRITGKSWEQLMREKIFNPLNMTSANFGPVGTKGKTHQPWGHFKNKQNQWQPIQADNAPALGPAGTIHCKLKDWHKFIAIFLNPKKPNNILSQKSLQTLITPMQGNYAAGWLISKNNNITTLHHAGSNTMWYVTVWVTPQKQKAYFVALNTGSPNMQQVCQEVYQYLKTNAHTH